MTIGLAATLFAAGACKGGPGLTPDFADSARENFEIAQQALEDEDWEEAVSFADYVRIRFPFSRFAVEAELLLARAQFEQGNYIIAQDSFKQFAKLHPTHRHTRNGWASYMSAVSAFMDAPESFFLLPPHYQRDQSQLTEALTDLRHFFDHYPKSPLHDEAEKLRDDINRRLLEHELYVARFYLERGRPNAAIARLDTAHHRYKGIGKDAEVLFLLGRTYLRIKEVELARTTFSELQARHPKHHHGKQATIYLDYIRERFGAADPNRKRPDRSPPIPVAPTKPKNPDDAAHPNRVTAPQGSPPKSEPAASPTPSTEPQPT